jgi:hypothetical protein
MTDDPLTDLETLYPGIKKEAVQATCFDLSTQISAGHSDDHLQTKLKHVWISANELLKLDQSLNRPLASLPQFYDNVKDRGEGSFFKLLRDTAEDAKSSGFVTRWAPLFGDGTSFSFSLKCSCHCLCLDVFYNAREDLVLYPDDSSVNGA